MSLLEDLSKQFEEKVAQIKSIESLDDVEQFFFSRKSGALTTAMKALKDLTDEERKVAGAALNEIKTTFETHLATLRATLSEQSVGAQIAAEQIDVTQPMIPAQLYGHKHPITQMSEEIEDLFISMGFMVVDGPELDSDYYNFESVNVPANHPARDMQDTLYIKDAPTQLMRTQTSTMQVRAMRQYGVPLRMIAPGRVFRNEATDARHEHTFYQIEGLVVDKDISLSHMKGVLETVAKKLYGDETQLRLRPKFYPFVEPGVNGEVTCFLCKGKGCGVCKHTGWLEIFGAGMTHPNVLREAGVDPTVYSAFAFGFGLNRFAMLKYGIDDVRTFLSGDVRFLEQF
jgi:phenylalanyl-tRNA synthetase alpha chain